MAFITPCSSSNKSWHAALLVLLWLGTAGMAGAAIVAQYARATAHDGMYLLSARFSMQLPPGMRQALEAGVPLVFVTEFEITRPTWYWTYRQLAAGFDPVVRRSSRLSFHALTGQYRVSVGSIYRSYPNLTEALQALGSVANWPVMEHPRLTGYLPFSQNTQYSGAVRLRLDTEQLPRLFQLNLLATHDWQLASDWLTVPLGTAGGR
jgi:hypothetical protein